MNCLISESEFKKRNGLKPALNKNLEDLETITDIPDIQLPKDFDWRHYNVVTPIKDQVSGCCVR